MPLLPLIILLFYRYRTNKDSFDEIYMERGHSSIWNAKPISERIGADKTLRTRNFLGLELDANATDFSCLKIDDEDQTVPEILKHLGKNIVLFGRNQFHPPVNMPVKICDKTAKNCRVEHEDHHIHAKLVFHMLCPDLSYTVVSK